MNWASLEEAFYRSLGNKHEILTVVKLETGCLLLFDENNAILARQFWHADGFFCR